MKKTCIALLALGLAVQGCKRNMDLGDVLFAGGGHSRPVPDTTPPTLAYPFPAPESALVRPTDTVSFSPSEALRNASVDHQSFVLRDALGKRVSSTIDASRYTLTPRSPLEPNARYTVTVAGIRDEAGNAMPTIETWSFTTGPIGEGTWRPISDGNGPQADGAVSVWTGTEWIVWGMTGGGRYDPATDTWRGMSSTAPPPPWQSRAVWTGTEMIVWRGGTNQGDRYDPVADGWTAMSTVGAPSPGNYPVVAWTGSRLIVFTGSDGALYDPATDLWTPMSAVDGPGSRIAPKFAWTGTELIVWGGYFYYYSGSWPPVISDTGRIYSPATDSWRWMSTAGAPVTMSSCAVWSGTELIVWSSSPMAGGRYDPVADVWRSISTPPLPYPAAEPVVWTGTEMILGAARGYGGRYNPTTDTWSTTTYVGEPLGVTQLAAVWTGSEVLAWGCREGVLWTGGAYKP